MTDSTAVATVDPQQAVAQAQTSAGSIAAFAGQAEFESAQRMALALASSSLVPADYRGKANVPNVLIAMELANRVGASVFAVMQNLDVIHGRPSWRSSFLIATVNASGRFSPLRFRFEGEPGTDEWGCRAVARDAETGDECVGPLVTIGIAKDEGWHGRKGSKWQTLPELMLTYRSAAFWTRVYCPELSVGLATADETHAVVQRTAEKAPTAELNAALRAEAGIAEPEAPEEPEDVAEADFEVVDGETVDTSTGEVVDDDDLFGGDS